MPNLTSVTVTAGVPTAGTGTVSTIDNIPALWDKGAGTGGSLTQRVIIDSSQGTALGQTTMSASSPVVLASDQSAVLTTIKDISNGEYETVAASQTDQIMGATGAVGDWIEGLLIVPGTAAAGAVSIKDGNGSAISVFAGGGTTALPTLAPIYVPLGLKCIAATTPGWKITTGANVTAIGMGNFT